MHTLVVPQSTRLSVVFNSHNAWTLKVANVKQSDEGEYMCQINTVPMISQVSRLQEFCEFVLNND